MTCGAVNGDGLAVFKKGRGIGNISNHRDIQLPAGDGGV
jgi:hypothetical protein